MAKKENAVETLVQILLVLFMTVGAIVGICRDAQPKFRDVTISVGEAIPGQEEFYTEFAVAGKSGFTTDLSGLSGLDVGDHPVTLYSGARQETVTLHIVDTLPPELEVQDLLVMPGAQLKPEDLVTHLWDHTDVTVSFAREPVIPENYSDLVVELIAKDTSGNTTVADATVSVVWMRTEYVLEYGTELTAADLLYDVEKDAHLISQKELDQINRRDVGEYVLTSTLGEKTLVCRITVQDTQGPVLELREHQEYIRGSVKLEDFVVSATDLSGKVTLTLLTTHDCSVEGPQTVRIEAKDIYGNVTIGETTLYVVTDVTPPVITGADKEMTVEKHSTPKYLSGVSATDDKDGKVSVSVDSSRVNTDVAGSYVVIYTAKDKSGNVATVRRKVTVKHDQEDTKALVASVAEKLSSDPEEIRDYVRSSIRYTSSWGGDDPVWTGFKDKHGNCYVHALCLKAVLDLKGHNTQLIWVTNKSHYWLVIEIEPGVWRHIDATPGNSHSRYSLMTDAQRSATLSGRDWDRSQWPVCE